MAKEKITARRLKAILAEENMTTAELSAKIGMNPSTFSLKMNGHSSFKREEIEEIHRLLQLTDDDLLIIFFPYSGAAQQYLRIKGE